MTKGLSLLVFLALVVGCTDTSEGRFDVRLSELNPPTGEASGEPFLSTSGEAVYMSWLQATSTGGQELLFSRLDGDTWSAPARIAASDRFFVNWADFPSLTPGRDGKLWAHWLQRGSEGGYDYGIRIVRSSDGGATWSEPFTPHEDGTPTEHGFVSVMPTDDGIGLIWLDGRQMDGGHGDEPSASGAMTLRYREIAANGTPGPEMLLDARTCECCQTWVTATPSGPVAVYRDRSEGEIRDIYVTRLVDGTWTEGVPVHEDGWTIGACPVNGPKSAMAAGHLAVTWFTAADDLARVKVAFSRDNGASFGPPLVIDDGNPGGRVDLLGLESGDFLVTWLERTGGAGAEVRMRRVSPAGALSESVILTTTASSRATGFPRIIAEPRGSILLAWTDASGTPTRVRVTRIEWGNE